MGIRRYSWPQKQSDLKPNSESESLDKYMNYGPYDLFFPALCHFTACQPPSRTSI